MRRLIQSGVKAMYLVIWKCPNTQFLLPEHYFSYPQLTKFVWKGCFVILLGFNIDGVALHWLFSIALRIHYDKDLSLERPLTINLLSFCPVPNRTKKTQDRTRCFSLMYLSEILSSTLLALTGEKVRSSQLSVLESPSISNMRARS